MGQVLSSPDGGARCADPVTSLLLLSKHSLGSHQYVQDCRKWESEISLQLLKHSTIRRDLARTVSHMTLAPPPAAAPLPSFCSSPLMCVPRARMTRVQLTWRSTWARWTGRSGRTSPGRSSRSGTRLSAASNLFEQSFSKCVEDLFSF